MAEQQKHELRYTGQDDGVAKFACIHCAKEIWFSKPGHGEPGAIADGEQWKAPDDFATWMEPQCSTS